MITWSGRVRGDVNQHVVAAARCVDDQNAVGNSSLDALASLPFEDDDDAFGDPSRVDSLPHLVDECSCCPSSVPPPTGRTRPDHICRINEEHSSSLMVRA